MAEQVDVLVIGAGPAGSTAAKAAALGGASVLVIEAHPNVGLPVQCAEYVPARISEYVALPSRCIAQRTEALHTYLPDGARIETPAKGLVLDRALFDKALAIEAHDAGARIWTGARAVERTSRGVLVRRGSRVTEVQAKIVIGADGPRSTVATWLDSTPGPFIDARQVEAILPNPLGATEVYFDPLYRGGYGWCFPKGRNANIGVGVSREMGSDPQQALEHLLMALHVGDDAIIGRTAGPVPSSGLLARVAAGNVLLAGDAAGLTHPITGAGILSAVISGTLSGRIAAEAVTTRGLSHLLAYQAEIDAFLGGTLRHARQKRLQLDAAWSDDPGELSRVIRDTWIAFRAYGRRPTPSKQERNVRT